MWNLLLYRRPRELEHSTISRSFFLSCERANLLYSAVYAPGHKTSLHTSLRPWFFQPCPQHTRFCFDDTLATSSTRMLVQSMLLFATLQNNTLFSVYGQSKPGGLLFCMLAWLPTFCRNPSRILLRIQNTRNAQVCRIHDTTTSNALTPSHPKTVAIINNAPVYPVEGCAKTCFRTSLRSVFAGIVLIIFAARLLPVCS